jgi:hypothetical protein
MPKILKDSPTIHNKSSLKSLSCSILGVDLPEENESVQSDWSTVLLSESQTIYAALDSWADAAIAEKPAKYNPDLFGLEARIDLFQGAEMPLFDLAERCQK